MKYVNYLLSKDIKPILVFDGQHLPSKREVEKSRREWVAIYPLYTTINLNPYMSKSSLHVKSICFGTQWSPLASLAKRK